MSDINQFVTCVYDDKIHLMINNGIYEGTTLHIKNIVIEDDNKVMLDFEYVKKLDGLNYDSDEFNSIIEEFIKNVFNDE